MEKTDVLVYSYKSKQLLQTVKGIIENAETDVRVLVLDQNPVNREDAFAEVTRSEYRHLPWDMQLGMGVAYKTFLDWSTANNLVIVSDDVRLASGWDSKALGLMESPNTVISGKSAVALSKKDPFFLSKEHVDAQAKTKTNWIDKNFIMLFRGSAKIFEGVEKLKYYGIEEYLSMACVNGGIDVYSATRDLYEDLGTRSLENLYVPYSLEHNYNLVVDLFNRNTSFRSIHKVQDIFLSKLPYPTNDVTYEYYKYFDIDVASDASEKYNKPINRIG